MTIWKNFLDVVIIPPTEINKQALELSQMLKTHGAPWTLDSSERMPHLSLLHFPLASGKTIDDVCDSISEKISGGPLTVTGISCPRHGAVFLDTDRPAWLVNATEALSGLLWGQDIAAEDERFLERWNTLGMSERMLANISKWRSPFMGLDFIPHFTLGFLPDASKAAGIVKDLPFQTSTWQVNELFLVQVGEGWTAQKILKSIKLL